MREIRRLEKYSRDDIREQWDVIALTRDQQLRSGRDLSFEFVLKPTILSLIENQDLTMVLDAGCGSGVLTEVLAESALNVVGVDMSEASIALAVSKKDLPKNISYHADTLENYLSGTSVKYSMIVANMVLQDLDDIESCLRALASKCKPGAILVATITHPWFWPTYWGYDKEPWFIYSEVQAIEAPFKISSDSEPIGVTTHFHRPLSYYIEKLSDVGFNLDVVLEPMPTTDIQKRYPSLWKFPRFLALSCSYHG